MICGITPLFVPGDRPERFAKAAASGADAMIIDLEDAVAPERKVAARAALRPEALPGGIALFVRVNAAGTAWYDADVAALAGLALAGVMLSKAETAEGAARLAATLPDKSVIALIESARGLASVREIAPHAARLAFGSIDFCADLGMTHEREMLLAARAEIVLASRLGGLPAPLDGVSTVLDAPAEVEEEARYARALGFGGKLCIHPRQIAPLRAGFAPTAAQIDWAERVLAAGGGAVTVDGKMVDEPVRIQARQILNLSHESCR
jgi:citrate lyase subunit beta/citryl-CoA lyase